MADDGCIRMTMDGTELSVHLPAPFYCASILQSSLAGSLLQSPDGSQLNAGKICFHVSACRWDVGDSTAILHRELTRLDMFVKLALLSNVSWPDGYLPGRRPRRIYAHE